VYCTPAQYPTLNALGDELRFLMITSQARVHRVEQAPAQAVPTVSLPGGGAWLEVRRTTAPKCVRCWHHRVDVGTTAEHPELCSRCVGNITGPGEARQFA
jgi:isoleucyl-tRNA synthetase